MTMQSRPIKWSLAPEGEPVFSERAFSIEIDDEGAGEYVRVTEHMEDHALLIDAKEWPALRDAIDAAVAGCRGEGS